MTSVRDRLVAQWAETKERMDLAADLGASRVRVFGNNFPKEVPKEKTLAQVTEALKEICDYGATKGIKPGLELHGEFDRWIPRHMKTLKDGSHSVTVTLAPGEYRFRYKLDDVRWENDWAADAYVPNPYGGEDSVIRV